MASPENSAERLLTSLASDHFEVVNALATAFAIRDDELLQTRLRNLSGAGVKGPFQISQFRGQVWLRVDDGRVTAHRQRKPGSPVLQLGPAIGSSSELRAIFQEGAMRSHAFDNASAFLDPFFKMNTLPLRSHFEIIQPWLPLIEQLSYKYGARAIELLDSLRSQMKSKLASGAIEFDIQPNVYWSGVNALAQCIMLASSDEARPWLIDMADQFVWTTWTPSFPLIRERTIWLAACAARSASSFGKGVIDKYLTTLSSARTPMIAFDALFGVCAIALNSSDNRTTLRSEISRRRRALERHRPPHFDYYDLMYADALRVLSGHPPDEVDVVMLGWHRLPEFGLATDQALRADPAGLTASGRYLGFSLLPIMCSTRPADIYPRTDHDLSVPSFGEVVQILRRAWVPDRPNVNTIH